MVKTPLYHPEFRFTNFLQYKVYQIHFSDIARPYYDASEWQTLTGLCETVQYSQVYIVGWLCQINIFFSVSGFYLVALKDI